MRRWCRLSTTQCFTIASRHRVIVNIGGIANLTDLPPGGDVTGFDCGPGNLLLDAWIMRQSWDSPTTTTARGRRSGKVTARAARARFWRHDFFARPPPKSTGREMFNLAWLEAHLRRH